MDIVRFALTLAMELAACLGRFGFKYSVKEHEAAVTRWTFGVRIH